VIPDLCVNKVIRPGRNYADNANAQGRSLTPDVIQFYKVGAFSQNLKQGLVNLARLTPNNRELAKRLLLCIVENRYQGTSSQCTIAAIQPGDVSKAIAHLSQLASQYPNGFSAYQHTITQRGQAANASLLPYSAPSVARNEFSATQLENLLKYQHILAEQFSTQAGNQQL